MKRFIKKMCVCIAVSASAGALHANVILNPSFETNSAGTTQFNVTNGGLGAIVSNVTGFGGADEIDVITGTAFGIAPQNGSWKLGLHSQGVATNDAFSFNLSAPIVNGTTYNLSFFLTGLAGQPLGTVAIGVSTSAAAFGTQVFSGTPADTTSWTGFSTSFIAPLDGSFLTVQILNGYTAVDNFSLDTNAAPVPEPSSYAMVIGGIALLASGKRFLRRR